MIPADTILSTQGTVEDVMAYFRKSERTIREWVATTRNGEPVTPDLAHWRQDRMICFGEEDVVRLRVKFYIADRGMKPGEAEALARREWRQLLRVRRLDAVGREMARMNERLDALSAEVTRLRRVAGAAQLEAA